MKTSMMFLSLVAAAALTSVAVAQQKDAGWKIRGEYGWSGSSAGRSMQSARDYSHDFRQYTHSVPKGSQEVAKEATDAIGQYITKAQKHMASMRKHAGGDKETLASLDVIDKNLAEAAKAHAVMCDVCLKENVVPSASMKCCEDLEAPLSKAIAEHDKLMKRLGEKPAAAKK